MKFSLKITVGLFTLTGAVALMALSRKPAPQKPVQWYWAGSYIRWRYTGPAAG